MGTKTPVLRGQTSSDIYKEALELARVYCSELKIPDDNPNYFNSNDPALVILKLFSEMTEFLLTQMNKIPDKYRLAFLDFIGLDLLPANPAKVPLTFSLSEGSSGAYIPARTSVASSKDPSIVFETSQDLSVVPTGLDSVFSLNPLEDKYIEHKAALSGKADGFDIFKVDENNGQEDEDNYEQNLDHILYLGDDILLDIRKETKITINFSGENLSQKYFGCWTYGNNNPIDPKIEEDKDFTHLAVSLSIPKLDKTIVNGDSSFWLKVRPKSKGMNINDQKLPKISAITASVKLEGIFPDAVIYNNTPVDLKKGFYPFGEEPKIGDTLYIGSEEVFSKTDAEICFIIGVDKDITENATLQWEYWNGSIWSTLNISAEANNSVKNFLNSGSITFTCPLIPIVEINGQPSRWIRIRLESGNYGTAGKIKQKDQKIVTDKLVEALKNQGFDAEKTKSALSNTIIDFGFEYEEANFNPPFIKTINISYSYKNRQFLRKTIYNNFLSQDFNVEESAQPPFIPYPEAPALYLGFKKNIAFEAITLFFALKEQFYSKKNKEIFTEEDQINLVWEYFSRDNTWKEFKVEDETGFFRRGGFVSFLAPSDIQKSFEFGRELYWIRARVRDSKRVSCPKIIGIFPNTVWALNQVTVENEVLGSGNGEPDLTLNFSKKSILKGQIVEIKEPAIPSTDELKAIEVKSGKDALRIVKEAGEVKEVWVIWDEIKDFALSDSLSRHYMLDRTNGKITFGDGIHGMIPPRGQNNIVARKYHSGGGKRGDVAAGTLTSLKTTIPYIESVTNRVPASGGMDPENIDSVIGRGSYMLKNGGRAVTKEDFEWLSYEASQYVAKAKCIAENGDIKVFIVPKSEKEVPFSEASFLDFIKRYLKERALVTLSDRIFVLNPEYDIIDAKIEFIPVSLAQKDIISDRIKERVKQFLHPLRGGQKGEGWDFGQGIFISEMAAVIEDLEGVDSIKNISLRTGNKKISPSVVSGINYMEIGSNSLPFAGEITFEPGG